MGCGYCVKEEVCGCGNYCEYDDENKINEHEEINDDDESKQSTLDFLPRESTWESA